MRKKSTSLSNNEKKALLELKRIITENFSKGEIILYGSKARGDYGKYSDIDVLVLLNEDVNNRLEESIFCAVFSIELQYDVIFGIIVYSKQFWNSDLGNSMPLHWNIDSEGIVIEKF